MTTITYSLLLKPLKQNLKGVAVGKRFVALVAVIEHLEAKWFLLLYYFNIYYVAYIDLVGTLTHARRDQRCTLHPLIGLYLSLLPLIEVISWAIEARSLSPVIESSTPMALRSLSRFVCTVVLVISLLSVTNRGKYVRREGVCWHGAGLIQHSGKKIKLRWQSLMFRAVHRSFILCWNYRERLHNLGGLVHMLEMSRHGWLIPYDTWSGWAVSTQFALLLCSSYSGSRELVQLLPQLNHSAHSHTHTRTHTAVDY